MELVQGMRDKRELRVFRAALAAWPADVLPIGERISTEAMFLVERYALSHGVRMADALVGATALRYDRPLHTANAKHYGMFKGIELVVFEPRAPCPG